MKRSHKANAKSLAQKPQLKVIIAALGAVFLLVAAVLLWQSRLNQTELISGGVPGVEFSTVSGTQVGQIAPDFTVQTLDGRAYTLADHNGKPAIVFFMAYWCGSCVPEAQALARLQQEYGDDISIIAIDLDPSSTPKLLEAFKAAADNGAFTWGFDTDQQMALAYEVQSLDTTLIVDSSGHVVFRDAFPSAYDQLKTVLEQLGL